MISILLIRYRCCCNSSKSLHSTGQCLCTTVLSSVGQVLVLLQFDQNTHLTCGRRQSGCTVTGHKTPKLLTYLFSDSLCTETVSLVFVLLGPLGLCILDTSSFFPSLVLLLLGPLGLYILDTSSLFPSLALYIIFVHSHA